MNIHINSAEDYILYSLDIFKTEAVIICDIFNVYTCKNPIILTLSILNQNFKKIIAGHLILLSILSEKS